MDMRPMIEEKLKLLMVGHDVGGHNFDHFLAVTNHAMEALKYENISDKQKFQIELAALLHDADDEKIFPNSKNYENARNILNSVIFHQFEKLTDSMDEFSLICQKLGVDISLYKGQIIISLRLNFFSFINEVIAMIDLVSCSKNGDTEPQEPHMALPRDCDRLEAIGQIGIDRCLAFTKHKKAPFHLDSTPRVYTEEELWKVATPERFTKYMNGGKSVSMIDHYYDKLLHIGKPESLRSQNKYILEEAEKRNKLMIDYVLNYWRNLRDDAMDN